MNMYCTGPRRCVIKTSAIITVLFCLGLFGTDVLRHGSPSDQLPPRLLSTSPSLDTAPTAGILQVFDQVSKKELEYPITNLTTRKRDVPMYLFDLYEDGYISLGILENGRWETVTFDTIESLFQKHDDLHFLDVGCHIGNFALMAAAWGRKVVAVDSCLECVSRLRKSVELNHFRDRITTVWNAVGDAYKRVSTKLVVRNYAAGYIVELNGRTKPEERQDPVPMIHMDDLLAVTTFKRAIMKLDIEGYEPKALKSAAKLFSKVDIPHVFMKWHVLKRRKQSAKAVVKFFRDRGYKPFEVPLEGDPLDDDYMKWPKLYRWRKVEDILTH